MNRFIQSLCSLAAVLCLSTVATAQNKIHYTGAELSNPAYHDGQLSPVVGVHNIQVMRANREHPDASNGDGWTYNHQPMMAYWQGKFYMHYLSDPKDEHVPSSRTLLMTSKDGYNWANPVVLFPPYHVPDGYTKPDYPGVAKNLIAIMHQRVGFYISKSGKLISMGFYGVALDKKDDPNDGNGIGRVVREIKKDGSFGQIYFIYYNHGFNEKNTDYPYFTKSRDKSFVKACQEILDNPLYRMQWVEEADRNDPLIPLKKGYKAFCYYHLPDGTVACLWKHALTSISKDGGNSWAEPVERAKGFVNSNAKIWGQRLTDGTYATVYNPSEFRWPLAISTSTDGLEYTTLNLINGEITPMRYGGNYKSYGPQYVRGIQEGNGTPPDGDLWVAYSMNKEDMWVSRIQVPIRQNALTQADDNFDKCSSINELTDWNIYSPLWAPVTLEKKDGANWLTLKDKDPFDYAKVERKIPATTELEVSFKLQADQIDKGTLQIEFLDENGIACSRLDLTPDGFFRAKGGSRFSNMMKYEAGKVYDVKALLSVANRSITVTVDGKRVGVRMLFAPVHSIERIAFRTGVPRTFPTPETPADLDYDLPNAGAEDPMATYYIKDLKTTAVNPKTSLVLNYDKFSHYVDYFNGMEDENIAQAIPNAQASEWMKENVPLFECPQKNFEEMYYYRWWTLRKHIKQTPVGLAMTEFLVTRSYADQYNLIACALGHHIYESRWLRDQKFLDQYIHVWFRGNGGQPMKKMTKFSSWAADAILNRYKVNGDKEYMLNMLPDLESEYKRWESTNRLSSGLFWQGDVQDGMEESISGGRKKKYARPTINSYMYGNARALSQISLLAGKKEQSAFYEHKADTLKQLVQNNLWNVKSGFFETLRTDSLANAREAIGYIPWYFNLPDANKYDGAWKQVTDEGGFLAPYGLTTAERRHPRFRMAGCCKCEWDGAIWPFASAQTMTAMANFMNNNNKQTTVNDSIYFRLMELYVESQYHRGRPYVGEYLDEVTGYWLKGDQERSRYYNHSTFNDLIITGLVGLRPRMDNSIEVNPLIPEDKWNWFCLDNVLYHGKNLTIVWDKDGNRYHLGKGFHIFVNGKEVGKSDSLKKIVCENVL